MDQDITKTIRRLKSIGLFTNVPEELLAELANKVQGREIGKNEPIVKRNDPGDTLFQIRSGWAKITTIEPSGNEILISHIGPGQTIGDVSMIDGKPFSIDVTALIPVTVATLSRQDFSDWLDKHPEVALDILRGISSKLRISSQYVEKAIEWSNRIAKGDYDMTMSQVNLEHTFVTTRGQPDETMVAEFLAAFHQMIDGVKTREATLKQQIQELTIKIDATKVDNEVSELTSTSFFVNLKAAGDRLRKKREEEES
jgi:CRP-like cAMP-binding protein